MRAEDLTKTLDLMVLAASTTDADIGRACAEARDITSRPSAPDRSTFPSWPSGCGAAT